MIGVGNIGTALARRLVPQGHEVMLSFTRDLAALAAFGASTGTPAPAAAFGDIVALAVPWQALTEALKQVGALKGKGLFIEATVFADASNDVHIDREEIFGPVVPVIPFDTEDDAIRIDNDTPFGLASGIQTGDMTRAQRLADRIKAGTVRLNTWTNIITTPAFGGFRMSGYGREQAAEALENHTQYKTVWANLGGHGYA